jgi:proteic killer suppression protein
MGRFASQGTADIANGLDTRAARSTCTNALWALARRKLDIVLYASGLDDLRSPPGNRLEALKGDRAVQYSVRVNERYRICFVWIDQGAQEIEIVDYH